MGGPLVSVIVPVYNVERYLPKCLDSICGQSYQNLDIILVDNNSSDNSPLICREYQQKDPRIRCAAETFQAQAAARNRGISIARGEWICFVDSDDFLHPQYVEILLRTVLEHGCLTVQCRYQPVYTYEQAYESGSGTVRVMDWRRYYFYVYEHNRDGHTPFGVWSNIYHKSLFENVRFAPFRFAEDSDFMPRIIYAASEKPLAVIDKVLYYYYQREGSTLHSKTSLAMLDRYDVKRGILDFWLEKSEMAMYHLFFGDFVNCMMIDYLNLSRDLPSEEDKYRFLKEEIEKTLPEAAWHCPLCINLHPGARMIWEKISGTEKPVILYGYGQRGKEIFRWLEHFQIPVLEIWDRAAKDGDHVGTIPCVPMHGGLPKDTLILIAIDDLFTAGRVQCDLRELGYENFLASSVLWTGIRYGQYQRYLPCILKNYEQLLQ